MARRLDQSISKTAALVGCSQSEVVSIHQKWSKEGTAVNNQQGHGLPRLTGAGSKVWSVCSDPTDELLLLKLLKLILVLIERHRNTQCITVSCLWGCIAADQSECPC